MYNVCSACQKAWHVENFLLCTCLCVWVCVIEGWRGREKEIETDRQRQGNVFGILQHNAGIISHISTLLV